MSDKPQAIIVGGGLVGLLTAYEFGRRGWATAVYESGEPVRQASWAGGGILSPLRPWLESEFVQTLTLESQRRVHALLDQFGAFDTVEYHRTGMKVLDPGQGTDAWVARYAQDAVMSEEGLLLPSIAQLRTPRFGRFAVDLCRAVNVAIRTARAVNEVITRPGGRLEVVWPSGQEQADIVCICAGAWSGQIALRDHQPGERVAIEPVRGQMIAYAPVRQVPDNIILSGGNYVIPRLDGRVLVGSTVEHVGHDTRTTRSARGSLQSAAESLLPSLKAEVVEHHWAGLRPKVEGLNDPIVGPSETVPGLWFNTGHYRNGVTLAAGSAMRLVNQVEAAG